MHCYTPAYYHHHILTPSPTAAATTIRTTHNYSFYPSNGSKTATTYPTPNGAGQLRIVAKAASCGGGGAGFAVAAEEEWRVSFYEVLGVAECGTEVEVKKAYKQLARKYHPDVSPPGRVEEYTRRFILVQQAYETLSDPALRALYDRDLAKGLQFAFSSPRRFHHYDIDQVMEQRNEWKICWQSQLSELKRRSKCKENGLRGNMSWAARMRKQRDESTN